MNAPWLTVAQSYVGMKEIPGAQHNPTILGWLKSFAKNIGKWGQGRDETPWCAVFVSHCLASAGLPTTEDARAASYATYGKPSKPVPGAIIVIRRKPKSGKKNTTGSNRGGYHVFFLDKITQNYVWGWGGNQGNQVSRAAFSRAHYDIIAVRWPAAI